MSQTEHFPRRSAASRPGRNPWQRLALSLLLGASPLTGIAALPAFTSHDFISSIEDPASVAAGDLDGDGDIDLVAAHTSAGKLIGYFNTGNETFQALEIGDGRDFTSVALGDLDGDADLDVVAGSDDGVEVFWGPGLSDFPGVQAPLGQWESLEVSDIDDAIAVLVADVDADSLQDIVFATSTEIILLPPLLAEPVPNSAAKAITDPVTLISFADTPPSGFVADLRAADLDGDGSLEVLYTDQLGGRFGVLTREPVSGVWANRFAATSLTGAGKFRIADLERDGRQDVLVVASGLNRLMALRQQADGTLLPELVLDGVTRLIDADVVDLNRDGALDIVVARDIAAPNSMLLLENVGGAFPVPVNVNSSVPLRFVHAVDMNRDGDADLLHSAAGPGTGDDSIRLFSSGSRQRIARFTAGASALPGDTFVPTVTVQRDFDRDGDIDIVAAGPTGLTGYERGAGGAMVRRTLPVTTAVQAMSSGDVDKDGDLDLFFAQGNAIFWLRNAGGWNFSAVALGTTAAGSQVTQLLGVDGDQDGDVDVVSGDTAGTINLWKNNTLTFVPSVVDSSASTSIAAFDVADVRPSSAGLEVVYGRSTADGTPSVADTFIKNIGGTGPRITLTSGQAGSLNNDVHIADVDGDGDLDILRSFAAPGTLVLFRNDGLVFPPVVVSPGPATGIRRIRSADVDADGDRDLIAAMGGLDAVVVYNSVGGARYTRRFVDMQDPTFAEPADLDGDGDLDLLADNGGQLQVMTNPQLHRGIGFGEQLIYGGLADDNFLRPATDRADLDGDRWAEIVVLDGAYSADRPRRLYVLKATDGLGAFEISAELGVDGQHTSIGLADLDGDSDTDIVLSGVGQPLVWLPNDLSNGNELEPTALATERHAAALGDFDGDAIVDMVSARTAFGQERVFMKGIGDGSFTESVIDDGNALPSTKSLTADLDADGDLDIVEIGPDALVVAHHGGLDARGVPIFDSSIARASGDLGSLALGDVDADGDVDVVYSLSAAGSVFLALNNGGRIDPAPAHRLLTPTASLTRPDSELELADIDGDGDLDVSYGMLARRAGVAPGFGVLENGGAGVFQPLAITSQVPEGLPWLLDNSPVLLDVNRDTRLDAVHLPGNGDDTIVGALLTTLNCGGSLQADGLRLTADGGSFVLDGDPSFVAGLQVTHRGRPGDAPLVLHTLPIALWTGDESHRRPLTPAEAARVLASLQLRLDDGNNLPDPVLGDRTVREFTSFPLTGLGGSVAGVFEMDLTAAAVDKSLVTLAPGQTRTYWLRAITTATASRVPGVDRLFFEFRPEAPPIAEPEGQSPIAATFHCSHALLGEHAPSIVPEAPKVILTVDRESLLESEQTIVTVSAATLTPVTGDQRIVVGSEVSDVDADVPDIESLGSLEITIPDGGTRGTGTVRLRAADDDFAENEETVEIFVAAASDGVSGVRGRDEDPSIAVLQLINDDFVDLDLSLAAPLPLVTTEAGGGATIGVRLASQPRGAEGDIIVSFESSDDTEGRIGGDNELVFDSENWDQFQAISLNGQDDDIVDGDRAYTVQVSADALLKNLAKAAFPTYESFDPEDLPAVNRDNDGLTLTLSLNPTVISEDGGVSTATVTRSGPTTAELRVNVTAINNLDVTFPATVTIPAGSATTTFAINSANATERNGTRTVTMRVTANTAQATAPLQIVDGEDGDLTLTLSLDPTVISENGGVSTATVTRSGPTTAELRLMTVVPNNGELSMPGIVTIPAGSTSTTFRISAGTVQRNGPRRYEVQVWVGGGPFATAFLDVIDRAETGPRIFGDGFEPIDD